MVLNMIDTTTNNKKERKMVLHDTMLAWLIIINVRKYIGDWRSANRGGQTVMVQESRRSRVEGHCVDSEFQ